MGMTPHPDEDAVLGLGIARRKIVALFSRDDVIDADEHQVLSLVDAVHQRMSHSYCARRWFESYLRNGNNEYTRRLARAADIPVVTDGTVAGELTTLVLAEDTKTRRQDCHPDDAA